MSPSSIYAIQNKDDHGMVSCNTSTSGSAGFLDNLPSKPVCFMDKSIHRTNGFLDNVAFNDTYILDKVIDRPDAIQDVTAGSTYLPDQSQNLPLREVNSLDTKTTSRTPLLDQILLDSHLRDVKDSVGSNR